MRGALICLVVIFLMQVLVPGWWWIMVIPFVYGVTLAKTGRGSFQAGAMGAGLLWLGWCLYLLVTGSEIIAGRIAVMFSVKYSGLLLLLTAIFAAVVAGISGWAGHFFRSALFNRRKQNESLNNRI